MVLPMPNGNILQRGYTYIFMLFVVAISGYGLAQFGNTWQAAIRHEQREEQEFVLNAYAQAFASYRLATPDGSGYRPKNLTDLLEDKRSGVLHRHLRKIYPNPESGKSDWVLHKDVLGIVAVCSQSASPVCSRHDLP